MVFSTRSYNGQTLVSTESFHCVNEYQQYLLLGIKIFVLLGITEVTLPNTSKIYPDDTLAVENKSLSVEGWEFVIVVGASECDKSTTLQMIAD